MTVLLRRPTNKGFKIKSGDFLRSEYQVAHHKRDLLVVRSNDRVEVYTATAVGPTLLGHVTFGSNTSGAIWKSGECIGEYRMDENFGYVITPIMDNRKAEQRTRGVDPVLYLLESLT